MTDDFYDDTVDEDDLEEVTDSDAFLVDKDFKDTSGNIIIEDADEVYDPDDYYEEIPDAEPIDPGDSTVTANNAGAPAFVGNEGSVIKLYNSIGGFIGLLNPISCTVQETLNGADDLQLQSVYDEEGLWKRIKPGSRIGVYVKRIVPKSITRNTLFTERYRIANVAANLRKVYVYQSGGGEIGDVDSGQDVKGETYSWEALEGVYAAVGQTIDIKTYSDEHQKYKLDTVQGSNGTTYSGTGPYYIDPTAVEIVRSTSDAVNHGFQSRWSEQIYVVQSIDLNGSGYSLTAVHETIDTGSALYFMNANAEETRYAPLTTLGDLISKIYSSMTSQGQSVPTGLVGLYLNETGAVKTSGWNASWNEILTSKLKEVFEYDILRSGSTVYIYDCVMRRTGLVLMVGHNLSALTVSINQDGGNMDNVIAYCRNRDTGAVISSINKSGSAARSVRISDDAAEAIATTGNEPVVRSRLAITAAAYRRSSAFKARGVYNVTVTPEIVQMDDVQAALDIVLGDIVTIVDPRLPDGSIIQRVTQRTQDCISGRITGITVGDVPKSLYDVIKGMRR